MQVHVATFLASSLSGFALVFCLMAISTIHSDIALYREELDTEIDFFKTATDDMWKELMFISAARSTRSSRGAYYESPRGGYQSVGSPAHDVVPMAPGGESTANAACVCHSGARNKCHPGPPGPKGIPGPPGPNALPGTDGVPGHDALDVTPESQAIGTCFYCPAGPPGSPGPMGHAGPRGMKGPDGQQGKPGKDGHPGHPGEMGAGGVSGKPGPAGPPGDKGLDGRKPIGRPGPKGQRGEPGLQGPVGDPGHNGLTGPAGVSGPMGIMGAAGPLGLDGVAGAEGNTGRPGQVQNFSCNKRNEIQDAEYCQCPQRKANIGNYRG